MLISEYLSAEIQQMESSGSIFGLQNSKKVTASKDPKVQN
jgi:hypothetical protein